MCRFVIVKVVSLFCRHAQVWDALRSPMLSFWIAGCTSFDVRVLLCHRLLSALLEEGLRPPLPRGLIRGVDKGFRRDLVWGFRVFCRIDRRHSLIPMSISFDRC